MASQPLTRPLTAVTSPRACSFYSGGMLRHLRNAGMESVLVSSPGTYLTEVSAKGEVSGVPVPMESQIAPIQDLVSLWKLYRTVRLVRPTIVDASTPKAGLLAGVAAWLARVP